MAKFKLQPAPTFKAPVDIPVAGGASESVVFTFKWRDREGFIAFTEGLKGRSTKDAVMDMASGWDLDDPFNEENVQLMLDNYLGSFPAVLDKYVSELTKAKEKN